MNPPEFVETIYNTSPVAILQ